MSQSQSCPRMNAKLSTVDFSLTTKEKLDKTEKCIESPETSYLRNGSHRVRPFLQGLHSEMQPCFHVCQPESRRLILCVPFC